MNRREFFSELASAHDTNQTDDPAVKPAVKPAAESVDESVDESLDERPFPRLTVVLTAGSPRQYRKGAQVLVAKAQAWLCRDELGFYAIDAYCPHLGCLIRPFEGGFICPCHGSRFDAAGECCSKPALMGLRYLYVDLDASGNLIIRRDRTADPNDRFIA